jgi:putative sigma-54 modulation protein
MNRIIEGILMTTEVTFRHFDSVPTLRDHAIKRIEKLTRFYDGITSAHVVLDVEQHDIEQKIAEISLGVFRQTLTARDIAETHEQAINRCIAQLRRQIIRYKDRKRAVDKDLYH